MIEIIPIDKKSNVIKKNTKKAKPITNAFLIADIHLGVRMGSEEWRENTREYFENFFIPLIKEKADEGSIILCLGDIFDDRKSINIAANDIGISIFEELGKLLPVYIINGNHDMYKKSDNRITSLRSLDNIPNIFTFKSPTLWTIGVEGEWKKDLMLIPYQGNMEKETNLVNQNCDADYVFMHTDLKNLRYDNGMSITMGVDTSAVKGMIYSGHIHKRQEEKNLVYVGSPFALRRSDLGNQKGIYQINFETGNREFYPNTVSPIYLKINLDIVNQSTDEELEKIFYHNYVDVLVKQEESNKVKVGELFERLNVFNPKKIEIKEIASEYDFDTTEEIDEYSERGPVEIIESLIDNTEEFNSEKKEKLKLMSDRYWKLTVSDED